MTGERLSASLATAAAANPLLRQYAPQLPLGMRRPAELPDTDLTDAFLPATDATSRSIAGDWRYGVIILRGHDSGRVRNVLARTGARSYLDYTTSLDDSPPGTEKMAVVRPSNEPSAAELQAIAAQHPGAAWAIGNEPNTGLQDNLSPRAYAAFFDRVVTAIREGDPSARIVAPNTLNFDFRCRGCAGDDLIGREWIDGFRAAYRELRGGEPPIDIWGIHAYEIDWIDPPMTDASVMQAQLAGLRAYLDRDSSAPGQSRLADRVRHHLGVRRLAVLRRTRRRTPGRPRRTISLGPDRGLSGGGAGLAGVTRPAVGRGALVRVCRPRSAGPDIHDLRGNFAPWSRQTPART